MQVSSVNSVAFRAAKVESPSPLVSGEWRFVSDKTDSPAAAIPKKESHWFRNTLLWIVGIAAATAALVGLRKTNAINKVMEAGGFKAQEGIGKKCLYCVGKLGDAAKWLKGKTWDKVAKLFKPKGGANIGAETATASAATAGAETAGVAESAAGAASAAV